MTNNNEYNPFLVRMANPAKCDMGITHIWITSKSMIIHSRYTAGYICTKSVIRDLESRHTPDTIIPVKLNALHMALNSYIDYILKHKVNLGMSIS